MSLGSTVQMAECPSYTNHMVVYRKGSEGEKKCIELFVFHNNRVNYIYVRLADGTNDTGVMGGHD